MKRIILVMAVMIAVMTFANAEVLFVDHFSDVNPLDSGWSGMYAGHDGGNLYDDIYTIINSSNAFDGWSMVTEDDAAAIINVDTTSYRNLTLSYMEKTDIFAPNSSIYSKVEWRVGNGTWQSLDVTSSHNWWELKTLNLPEEAEDQSDLQIRFWLDDHEMQRAFWDDIILTGDYFDDTAPTITSVTHDPMFPQCSDNVEICANVEDENLDHVVLIWDSGTGEGSFFMDLRNGSTYCKTLSGATLDAFDGMNVVFSIWADDTFGNEAETDEYSFTFDCAAPVVDFSCSPQNGDEPLSVMCHSNVIDTVDSSDDLTYEWILEGGAPNSSDSPNVSVTYYADGLYSVALRVTDRAGNSNMTQRFDYIEVNDVAPEADFEVNGTFLEGETVFFTDTSVSYDPIVSWLWSFGDGETSNEQNPSHVFNDDGWYNVSLEVCDEDGCDTTTQPVYIQNVPPFSHSSSYVCNEGETITLVADGSDVSGDEPLTYRWFINGNYFDGQEYEYTCGNGNDEVEEQFTVIDGDGGETNGTVNITIYNVPPEVEFDEDSYIGSINNNVCFSATVSDPFDNNFTYMWDFDYDGNFSANEVTNAGEVCVSYGSRGVYTVAVKVMDDFDYSNIDTAEVRIFDYHFHLGGNWNLISLPLVPKDSDGEDNTNIDFVFGSDVVSKAEVIWSYTYDPDEGRNVWRYNIPNENGTEWTDVSSRVRKIIPGYGYYIKMNEETDVYENGEKYYNIGDENDAPMPPTVTLASGWNLIGHYGVNEVAKSEEIQDLSGGSLTDLASLTVFDKNGNPVSTLMPTVGYWTFVTNQGTLDYVPSESDYQETLNQF